jgi:hypothetical protein
MAGILDNKTRIMDVLITDVGRQQLAAGKLQIKFASFTDMHSFYESDPVSGSADATNRIYFEASSRPQDLITYETDDSGNLFPIQAQGISLRGTSLNKRNTVAAAFGDVTPVAVGADFATAAKDLITQPSKNFKQQYFIKTLDPLFVNEGFRLSTGSIFYNLDNGLFPGGKVIVNLENVENLFFDKRLSHIPNFNFLPPVVLDDGDSELVSLGDYANLNQSDDLSYDEIIESLQGKPIRTIDFVKTSPDNNVLMQFFETSAGNFQKLDAIDFGSFATDSVSRPGKHVIFVGKVYTTSQGDPRFINMFTIILD